jgi:hypothetical protein
MTKIRIYQGLVFAPDPAPGVQAGRSAVVDTASAIHGTRSRPLSGAGTDLCRSTVRREGGPTLFGLETGVAQEDSRNYN